MANILARTEAFADTTYWRVDTGGVNVTATTYAAPTFAGPSAGPARELEDDNAGATEDIRSDFWYLPGPAQTWPGPTDGSSWTFSIYIRQGSAVFPRVQAQWFGGEGNSHTMDMNLSTGATSFDGESTGGSESLDGGLWWRFWMTFPNDTVSPNNDIRFLIFPRYQASMGGGADSSLTGSIIVWGANLTNTSSVQTYEPDPFYAFSAGSSPIMTAALPIFR